MNILKLELKKTNIKPYFLSAIAVFVCIMGADIHTCMGAAFGFRRQKCSYPILHLSRNRGNL